MENLETCLQNYGLKGYCPKGLDKLRRYLVHRNTYSKNDVSENLFVMGFLSFVNWEMYFKPNVNITKETEKEISHILYSCRIYKKNGKWVSLPIPISKVKYFLKEKENGINELIKSWELEKAFLGEEMIIDLLRVRLKQRIEEIINETDLLKKLEEELYVIITGKENKI